MSALDVKLIDLAHRALERRDPSNLRRYPSVPEADDTELRERLRHEQQDEPRYRSSEDQAADDAGVRRWGEL